MLQGWVVLNLGWTQKLPGAFHNYAWALPQGIFILLGLSEMKLRQ